VKKRKTEKKDGDVFVKERSFGRFYRSFNLPRESRTDAIKAKFKNGVLKIDVPMAEAAKPKNIEIR